MGSNSDAIHSLLEATAMGTPLKSVTAVESTLVTAIGTPSNVMASSEMPSDDITGALRSEALPLSSPTTPGIPNQGSTSLLNSHLDGDITFSSSLVLGAPSPLGPVVSVTLPPLSMPTDSTPEDDQTTGKQGIGNPIPVSPTPPSASGRTIAVSIFSPSVPSGSPDFSNMVPSEESGIHSSESSMPGLDDIISDDGQTDVDEAAFLSGLSNVVDQIVEIDPQAAGDLTDAVVEALPAEDPEIAGVISTAQDVVESGSSDDLASIIPSLGDALGEDILPVDPIDPTDTLGALGNVVNRGKTIIDQVKEAMGNNIDSNLQAVIDNIARVVDSAEEQLASPMCLVSQVVDHVTNQLVVPCSQAGPDAIRTIADLAHTDGPSPISTGNSDQHEPQGSSNQFHVSNGTPEEASDVTREDQRPSQDPPGGDPLIAPEQTGGSVSNIAPNLSSLQPNAFSPGTQPSSQGGSADAGELLSSKGGLPSAQEPSGPVETGDTYQDETFPAQMSQGNWGTAPESVDEGSLAGTVSEPSSGPEGMIIQLLNKEYVC